MNLFSKACDLLAQSYELPKEKALEKVQHAQQIFKGLHAWPEYWKTRIMESKLFLNEKSDEETPDEAEAHAADTEEQRATGN